MGPFRYFFFDWDGCLADTLPIWHGIYRELLRRRGIEVDDRTIVRELFNDWAGPARFGIRQVEEFAREVQAGLAERVGDMHLSDHAAEAVRELHRRGARCAVLTATRRGLVTPVLERAGLQDCFDVLLTLDEVPRYKPDPEIVHRALRALRASATDTVLVGDSGKDLQTAVNAGIASVLYFPPANARYYDLADLEKHRPDHVIRDLRELAALGPGGDDRQELGAGGHAAGGEGSAPPVDPVPRNGGGTA